MVSSFWKQLVPKITIGAATHLYYGKYPYKLELEVTGAQMVRDDTPFAAQIDHQTRFRNYGGSWRFQRQPNPDDLVILEAIRSWRKEVPDGMKIRIEASGVQIYSESEQALKDFVEDIFDTNFKWIVSITAPKSKTELATLQSGIAIHPKRKLKFKYKFIIRDGRYSPETRSSVLNMLEAQGDQVRITPSTQKMLSGKNNYIWNCYFYANDESINLMVNLIAPAFIRSIVEYQDTGK